MKFPDIRKIAAYIAAVLFIITTAFAANSYVAKDKDLQEVKVDVAMLGKAFQIDAISRRIDSKMERVFKINDRLRQHISQDERTQLEEIKRDLEKDIEKLNIQQKKLE